MSEYANAVSIVRQLCQVKSAAAPCDFMAVSSPAFYRITNLKLRVEDFGIMLQIPRRGLGKEFFYSDPVILHNAPQVSSL